MTMVIDSAVAYAAERLGSIQEIEVVNKNGRVLRYSTLSESGIVLEFTDDGKTLKVYVEGANP